jgi:hypothetical protein
MTDPRRQEIITVVGKSPHTIQATLNEIGVSRRSYYRFSDPSRVLPVPVSWFPLGYAATSSWSCDCEALCRIL